MAVEFDPADGDTTRDVFVRDLQDARTTLVTRATGISGSKSNGFSSGQDISHDGHRVTFYSDASNLDPTDGDAIRDVFVRVELGAPAS
jgi:hypothetical protein